jgi:DtxR family Mn-dependent transcriptional regulator
MKKMEQIEEALETLWICLEENSESGMAMDTYLYKMLGGSLEKIVQYGFVEKSDKMMRFTNAGRRAAEQAIRRHRLSERLFHDVIDTNPVDMETAACQMEHVVKKEIEEKICRLLGHPQTCPHGKPIPPGRCCQEAKRNNEKFVVPLAYLKKGEEGEIAYIKTGDSKKLQKFMAMGVLPGNIVSLDRGFPSVVFSVGYSQYAVDKDMADAIFVRREKRIKIL